MTQQIRRAWWFAIPIFLATLPACSPEPTAPLFFKVTGRVTLTGFLTDEQARFAGTRVVGDPDGVLVELVFGDRVAARTTTVDGVYTFTGIRPGGYLVQAPVIGTVGDVTRPVTVASTDLAVADTLRLVSRGDLYPVPNPSPDTTRVYFQVTGSVPVTVRIMDLAGNPVRQLVNAEIEPGLRLAHWDGRDEHGVPATAPIYWVTFASGSDYRAQLLFR